MAALLGVLASAKPPALLEAEVDALGDVRVEDIGEGKWRVVIPLEISCVKSEDSPQLRITTTEDYPKCVEAELIGTAKHLLSVQVEQLHRRMKRFIEDYEKDALATQADAPPEDSGVPRETPFLTLPLLEVVLTALADPSYNRFSSAFPPCKTHLVELSTPYTPFHTSEFNPHKIVGAGVHGKVYRCILGEGGAASKGDAPGEIGVMYALKRFLFNYTSASQDVIREIGTLQRLTGHPYVLDLMGIAADSRGLQLVMSYHVRTLHDIKFKRDIDQITRVSYQLLSLASFLAEQNILNRDWKPANVLWDEVTQTIKLADFGQARILAPKVWSKHIFTLDYRPPEVCLGSDHYDNKTDVWSIALIIYFMAVRGPLFDTDDEDTDADLLRQIFTELGAPTVETWPELAELPNYKTHKALIDRHATILPDHSLKPTVLKDDDTEEWHRLASLLESMIVMNPEKRATASKCMDHVLFAELRGAIAATSADHVEAYATARGDGYIYCDPPAEALPAEGPKDLQLMFMKKAHGYSHPPRRDVTPLLTHPSACGEAAPRGTLVSDPARRSKLLRDVLVAFQIHAPLPPRAYLLGVHLFDMFTVSALHGSFTEEAEGLDDKAESAVFAEKLATIASFFVVQKLEDDRYFDESSSEDDDDDTKSDDSDSTLQTHDTYVTTEAREAFNDLLDEHLQRVKKEDSEEEPVEKAPEGGGGDTNKRDAIASFDPTTEGDDEEEDEEEEEEEDEEDEEDEEESNEDSSLDDQAKLQLVLEAVCGAGAKMSDLRKVEHWLMVQTGLRLYAQVTLADLQAEFSTLPGTSVDDVALYECLAVIAMTDAAVPLRHSVTEIHKALTELLRMRHEADPVAATTLLLERWDGKKWPCDSPTTTPLPATLLTISTGNPMAAVLSSENTKRLVAAQKLGVAWASTKVSKEPAPESEAKPAPQEQKQHTDPTADLDPEPKPVQEDEDTSSPTA